MPEKKDWYGNGVGRLSNELSDKAYINTYHINRCLYIYNLVNTLMQLFEDYQKCNSSVTKNLISERMKGITDELRHYKIFDDRFEEIFDEGR